jgi:hypothetical protein
LSYITLNSIPNFVLSESEIHLLQDAIYNQDNYNIKKNIIQVRQNDWSAERNVLNQLAAFRENNPKCVISSIQCKIDYDDEHTLDIVYDIQLENLNKNARQKLTKILTTEQTKLFRLYMGDNKVNLSFLCQLNV